MDPTFPKFSTALSWSTSVASLLASIYSGSVSLAKQAALCGITMLVNMAEAGCGN
ncbi:hypothetical protein BD311DRAFT_767556 [Dichomitus squalens]|uniref:Uncharacterized protein n=1 Tax=Dichomitus squalens TaxID=114155 RepID=A0A4Q9MDS4_9APHY|nr:hypothetical protein BD311DRAFT_767556 [Dichomitus squalens]